MIIGLSGYARSGKDTIGAYLVEKHGFTRLAFGDGVREAALALDPIVFPGKAERLSTVVERRGWEDAKKFDEIRRTLQRMGTEVGREVIGPQVWVDALFNKMKLDVGGYPQGDYVITDVRFHNEYHAIKNAGGYLVRVQRQGVGPANEHISETGLDTYPFDQYLFNDGSIEQLQEHVDLLRSRLLTRTAGVQS